MDVLDAISEVSSIEEVSDDDDETPVPLKWLVHVESLYRRLADHFEQRQLLDVNSILFEQSIAVIKLFEYPLSPRVISSFKAENCTIALEVREMLDCLHQGLYDLLNHLDEVAGQPKGTGVKLFLS